MPPRELVVSDPEAVALLASPVRDAILQTVVNHGRVSIREIADQIGAKPGSLYRHIDALVGVGLIRECGSRKTARRDAAVYEADGDVVRITRDTADPKSVDAIRAVVEARARHAGRDTARAMDSDELVTEGPLRELLMIDLIGWLDEGDLERVNRHVAEVAEIFRNASRRDDARLFAFTAMSRPSR